MKKFICAVAALLLCCSASTGSIKAEAETIPAVVTVENEIYYVTTCRDDCITVNVMSEDGEIIYSVYDVAGEMYIAYTSRIDADFEKHLISACENEIIALRDKINR